MNDIDDQNLLSLLAGGLFDQGPSSNRAEGVDQYCTGRVRRNIGEGPLGKGTKGTPWGKSGPGGCFPLGAVMKGF